MYNIGSATDNNYAQHLGIMIYSLLRNTSEPELFHFYIVDGGISLENKEKINQTCVEFKSKCTFIIPDYKYFENLYISPYFGIATYFRLYLIHTIKVDRILFLDCDLIVEHDIKDLYLTDLQNNIIAAVPDYFVTKKHLNVHSIPFSFNAGVMLIDVLNWNNNDVTSLSLEYLANNKEKCEFVDQDALNVVLMDKWLELPYYWNMVARMGLIKFGITKACIPNNKNDEVKDAILNPKIIHYANRLFKPWYWLDPSPYKKNYLKYKAMSPWRDEPFADKSIKGFIKRIKFYYSFSTKHLKKKYFS